jgi:D-3-phosphoglycerate dehydrogenase
MKPGVRVVNCARGGLVDEAALRAALDSGRVAGAAIDVFSEEPARENVLFGAPNLVCTPHLGAATTEAQENVAIQIAEQMSDYLTTGAVRHAVNMPSITAEEAPRLIPFVRLAEQLGSFAGQLTESGVASVRLEYEGDVAEMNTRALTAAALAGFLRPVLQSVNMVSAPAYTKERGIHVEETRRERRGAYESYIRLTVVTERQERSVAGTVFSDGKPRIIQIKGINMEAELSERMLYITNNDKPGFIGRLGTLLGDNGINIARMQFGRDYEGGNAIALVSVDQSVSPELLAAINQIPNVQQVKPLSF